MQPTLCITVTLALVWTDDIKGTFDRPLTSLSLSVSL